MLPYFIELGAQIPILEEPVPLPAGRFYPKASLSTIGFSEPQDLFCGKGSRGSLPLGFEEVFTWFLAVPMPGEARGPFK